MTFDDKVETGEFSQESLEVKGSVLDEGSVLISNRLFWGNKGNRNARESFCKDFMEQKELVVASLAVPSTLSILSSNFVCDVASVVLWIFD